MKPCDPVPMEEDTMTVEAEMTRLLSEIEKALPETEWKEATADRVQGDARDKYSARMFEGTSPDGWHFVAIDFSIESQGFAPGTRGHDGVGRKDGIVIRFTRQLAEKAFEHVLQKSVPHE